MVLLKVHQKFCHKQSIHMKISTKQMYFLNVSQQNRETSCDMIAEDKLITKSSYKIFERPHHRKVSFPTRLKL